jgi:hypothetical protein
MKHQIVKKDRVVSYSEISAVTNKNMIQERWLQTRPMRYTRHLSLSGKI